MAASNDNQGLKIAVAALATFTVLFASTSYYFYSDGSKAKASAEAERKKASEAASQQTAAEEALKNLGVALGYANIKAGEGGTFAEVDAIKGAIMRLLATFARMPKHRSNQKFPMPRKCELNWPRVRIWASCLKIRNVQPTRSGPTPLPI